jgi:hypothetical protein
MFLGLSDPHPDQFVTDPELSKISKKRKPEKIRNVMFEAVLRIRIRMFLGLLDPAQDPYIINQK